VSNSSADKLNKPGAVGVIPTDTVYGLAARAADPNAVERLYELKKREAKPGTLIAANIGQLEALGLKHRYLKAVEEFWPGAVSVVIPAANPELKYLHRGKMSLAVRLPDDAKLQKLLEQTGPLLTTSANQPGEPTATTIKQTKAIFGGQVDFYEDGGDLSNRQPSTVIRIIDDVIEVLRPGAIKVGDDTMNP
jgi:tRNA threonylcarbamoyl adenosine modification protein (Sua5/YciO/YrdC/YwlC family)